MRRDQKWYIDHATAESARANAVGNYVEAAKHDLITFRAQLARLINDPRRDAYGGVVPATDYGRAFMDVIYGKDKAEWSDSAKMLKTALGDVACKRSSERVIYAANYNTESAWFMLRGLRVGTGLPTVSIAQESGDKMMPVELAIPARAHLAGTSFSGDRLENRAAVPLLRGHFNLALAQRDQTLERFVVDQPNSPTQLIVGKSAIMGWAQHTLAEPTDEIQAEFAEAVLNVPPESWEFWREHENTGIGYRGFNR